MNILEVILLVVATVLIIAGSIIEWRIIDSTDAFDNSEATRSQYGYRTLEFVFALVASWILWLAKSKDAKASALWRYVVYAFFFYITVYGFASIETMDDLRHAEENDIGVGALTAEETRKILGGTLLNYFGLFVLLFVAHDKFKFSFNIATILFIVSIVLDVIGIIILWNLDPLVHDGGNEATREFAFNTAVSMTAALLIIAGSILFEHAEGANFTAIFFAIEGIWFLANGFGSKAQLQNGGDDYGSWDDDDVDQVWAGQLFCWFAAFVIIVAARFAAASKSQASDNKVTPIKA